MRCVPVVPAIRRHVAAAFKLRTEDDRCIGASLKWSKAWIRTVLEMRLFMPRRIDFGYLSGRAETVAVEHDAIGAVA
jgi:hypothetical protein